MASTITIEVTGYNGKPISQAIHADFDEKGGTIGRGPENTLVLLDPERKISRTHATLSFTGDEYVLRDQGSLTPVILNGQALGNGREALLEPGDEIRIAGYSMSVRAAGVAAEAAPTQVTAEQATTEQSIAEQSTAEPSTAETVTPVPETPAATPPAREAAATDVDETPAPEPEPEVEPEMDMPEPVLSWTSAAKHGSIDVTTIILAPSATPAEGDEQPSADATDAPIASAPTPPAEERKSTAAASTGTAESKGTHSDDALLDALLTGAGIRGIDVPGGLTPERMRQMGALLREATGGLLDLLAARALTKREVRADMTVIVASDNNPLKFSPDREAALTHLMVPRGRGFMPPLRAVSDAYDDLRAHQLGFMAGMRSALAVVLGRFNPHTLEQRMTGTTMVDSFLPTHRKAKLWDLFGELYASVSKEAHTDFHVLFGHEFLRAYQAHVAKTPPRTDSDTNHR